ncbi:mitochondrial 37S ribosomal protein rsm10 [Spiromyces aspiralis]|uniref:Mitochondrial 37S ribosomal protein rsm10 n=1 Tax=Spiromyces aspiralis TaxID=68401 RepID=A0ACC1HV05_9FUNG|nr:mitochondrial 37S ribosomal protein rsm10 [Spiromyces aspiralis]
MRSQSSYAPILDKIIGTKRGTIEPMIPIDKIDPIYAAPIKVPPKYGVTVMTVQFSAHSLHRIDFYIDFCQRAAAAMNIPCTGTIYLPTKIKRWTVLKSPFVHKSSMENFERRTHKRLLKIHDTHPETLQKWLEYIKDNVPAGIGIRTRSYDFEEVGVGKSLEKTINEVKKSHESSLLSRGRRVRPPPLRYWNIVGMADKVAQALVDNPKANIEKVTAQVIEDMKPKVPEPPKRVFAKIKQGSNSSVPNEGDNASP